MDWSCLRLESGRKLTSSGPIVGHTKTIIFIFGKYLGHAWRSAAKKTNSPMHGKQTLEQTSVKMITQ